MSSTELDAARVGSLLDELARRLRARGIEGQIYIVGGAAVALRHDRRRLTADIDAVFDPEGPVREEATRMAEELGLPKGWLSRSAAAWTPGPSTDLESTSEDRPGLGVRVASPRHLLAMKMVAARPKDRADLVLLFARLEISSADQAATMTAEVYGDHFDLPDHAELVLTAESVLAAIRKAQGSS